MPVEYQGKTWYFLPPVEDGDVESSESQANTLSPDEWFAVHFLHDLESLFWVYFWFVHFRVPRRSVEEARKGDPTLARITKWRDEIQRRSQLYFFCKIDGKRGRDDLIRDDTGRVTLKERDVLAPLYKPYPQLLNLVLFPRELRKEYKIVQQQTPYKDAAGFWRLPAEGITDRLYRLFEEGLTEALSILGDDPLPTQNVDMMHKAVSSSITTRPKRGRDEAETEDTRNDQVVRGVSSEEQPRSKRQKSQAQAVQQAQVN